VKKLAIILVFFGSILASLGLNLPPSSEFGFYGVVNYFKVEADQFYASTVLLEFASSSMSINPSKSAVLIRKALVDCRLHYKKIEFFLEYFFRSEALIYNSPPKAEVEEPYMEFEQPRGFQEIESLLMEKPSQSQRKKILQQAKAISSSAKDLKSLLFEFKADDKQILESLRIELIRIMALSMEGFDAPYLKTGILESRQALLSIQTILQIYWDKKYAEFDSVFFYLNRSLLLMEANLDFDSFDRLGFLVGAALPLQHHLQILAQDMNMELNTSGINDRAVNLFSQDALDLSAFPNSSRESDLPLVHLGKRLFSETALSGNNSRSCRTCHQPEKYFTDQLVKNLTYDKQSRLKRNTPTLLYAAFQYSQFWDGRSRSLEDQIKNVLQNPQEMNADYSVVLQRLEADDFYKTAFARVFSQVNTHRISMDQLAGAIAAYLRTLNPRNSNFDKYMQGNLQAMTQNQIKGFNLFMGKAQCGTCHFAPLFNGLIPPLYKITELEVLGVPLTDNFKHPLRDLDSGRFSIFPISFYDGAFKTPTVRNIANTAPYMHHGAFPTLHKVIDFYNKGGGKGLGLQIANQTLSSVPLLLSEQEIQNIISFLHALTDSI
jgi:cytochrome c peroxidase